MIGGFAFKGELAESRIGQFLVFGWLAILVLLPFHGFLSVWLSSIFGGYLAWRSWKEALLLALLGSVLIYLWRFDRSLLRQLWHRRVNQLILVYAVLHIGIAFVAGTNLAAVQYALVYNLRFLGLFLLAQVIGHYWSRTAANKLQLQRLILWPAAVVIGFGLLQMFILPDDFLRHFGYGPDTIEPYATIDAKSEWVRIFSFTRGANQLGQYLILPLVLLGALWLKRRSRQLAIAITGGLLVMVGSYSRSAWLGLVAAALSYGVMSLDWKKYGRQMLLVLGAGLLLLVGLIYAAPHSEDVRLILFHDDQAATDAAGADEVRSSQTRKSLNLIENNPFGYGPGAAGPASFHNDEVTRINDNYYLQLALEVGVLGLGIFLAICWLTAKSMWGQRSELWPRVLLSVFVGVALINLFLPAWAQDEISLFWWGLAGIWYRP